MTGMVLKTFADSPEPVIKSKASFTDHCTSTVKLVFTLIETIMSQVIVNELPDKYKFVLLVCSEIIWLEEVDVRERLGAGTAYKVVYSVKMA